MIKDHWIICYILVSDSKWFVGCIFMWITWEPFGCSLVTSSSDKYDVLYLAENFLTCCHVIECDYRLVLDWWLSLLYTMQQCMTKLYSSLLHTHWCPQSRRHYSCLVAASNGRRSPSSGFPNCPQPQLPDSNSNSLQLPESQESSNSMQQLTGSYLQHLGTDRIENTVPLL
jgi:hypothetical protein